MNEKFGTTLGLGTEIGGDPNAIWLNGRWESLGEYQAFMEGFFADHGGVVRRGLFQQFLLPQFRGRINVWYYCHNKRFKSDSVEWMGPTDLAEYFPLPSWIWRPKLAEHTRKQHQQQPAQ